jgi:uncharacterized protein (DUF305 family)
MIDHHQMALDMANDCLKKASSDAVKKICQSVITAQTPEIKQMQEWLKTWYKVDYQPISMIQVNASVGGEHAGHNMGGLDSDPAMMMGMFAGLNRLTGKAYESAWLEAMIDHHDDAIHNANRILKTAQHAVLKALAIQIVKDQTAEIDLMESLLKTLGVS